MDGSGASTYLTYAELALLCLVDASGIVSFAGAGYRVGSPYRLKLGLDALPTTA
jgi:hypothetical protein